MRCSTKGLIYILRLKKFNLSIMWKIDKMIIKNPSFPWIPPSGVWVLVKIHLTEVAIPVISVNIVTHHNIRVARLLRLLNLANQLLLPKCKYRWITTSPINNDPIIMWIHTDRSPLLWITSSCNPEINIEAEATSRPQLHSLSLAIFFILFQGYKYSVGAHSDTFTATNASISINYTYVLVKRNGDFSKNVFRTSWNAIPTCNTFMGVDRYELGWIALLKFWEYHNRFLFAKFSKFD